MKCSWTPGWNAQFQTQFSTGNTSGTMTTGFGGSPAEYVIGTFTADASSQTVNYHSDPSLDHYGLVAAVQFRSVPEPASYA